MRYKGIVQHGVVVLEPGVELPEGVEVEVDYSEEPRKSPRLNSEFLQDYARRNPPPQSWFDEDTGSPGQ
jgi:hypothetical protein